MRNTPPPLRSNDLLGFVDKAASRHWWLWFAKYHYVSSSFCIWCRSLTDVGYEARAVRTIGIYQVTLPLLELISAIAVAAASSYNDLGWQATFPESVNLEANANSVTSFVYFKNNTRKDSL